MSNFYKKNENGEFVDADADVDQLFREKSDSIVSARLGKVREKETARIREEITEETRKNALEEMKSEAKKELEAEYKDKLSDAEARANTLDVKLRRKTIAAEYGFKPESEDFLGEGSDDDMRAKADLLKKTFQTESSSKSIDKTVDDEDKNIGAVTLL